MSHRRELYWYIKHRIGQTWLSYIILIGFFMLGIDLFKGAPQSILFYFSVITPLSLAMALVELIFFRKVIIAEKEDLPKIEATVEALGYADKEQVEYGRYVYSMTGRKVFLRAADIILIIDEAKILLNVNIFHLRYFNRFKG